MYVSIAWLSVFFVAATFALPQGDQPPNAARTFAPYIVSGHLLQYSPAVLKRQFKLNSVIVAFVTVAFKPLKCENGDYAQAELDGEPALAWMGSKAGSLAIGRRVKALDSAGIKPIVSFGGYASPEIYPKGNELSNHIVEQDKLNKAYVDFVYSVGAKHVDFDLEVGTLTDNVEVRERRSRAMRYIQDNIPSMQITITAPASTAGLTLNAYDHIKAAHKAGVRISTVNVMIMDFNNPGAVADLWGTARQALESTKLNLTTMAEQDGLPYPAQTKIGLTPMIGQSDFEEIFTLQHAAEAKKYALDPANNVNFVSMWSLGRDKPLKGAIKPDKCSKVVAKASADGSGVKDARGAFAEALRV